MMTTYLYIDPSPINPPNPSAPPGSLTGPYHFPLLRTMKGGISLEVQLRFPEPPVYPIPKTPSCPFLEEPIAIDALRNEVGQGLSQPQGLGCRPIGGAIP